LQDSINKADNDVRMAIAEFKAHRDDPAKSAPIAQAIHALLEGVTMNTPPKLDPPLGLLPPGIRPASHEHRP